MIIYVSGKYSGDIDQNIADAREASQRIWETGNVALCPHLNTAHFEIGCDCSYDEYMQGDLALLARCDAIYMLPGWEESQGACQEREFALLYDIPVYFQIPTSPHPVEVNRPHQAQGFIAILMQMYRTHLSKNMDYSPANIIGSGQIGLVTRIWDKVARLMNLTGFRMEIASSKFEMPQEPKNESINDTLMDLSVYGVIAQLFRAGDWGR